MSRRRFASGRTGSGPSDMQMVGRTVHQGREVTRYHMTHDDVVEDVPVYAHLQLPHQDGDALLARSRAVGAQLSWVPETDSPLCSLCLTGFSYTSARDFIQLQLNTHQSQTKKPKADRPILKAMRSKHMYSPPQAIETDNAEAPLRAVQMPSSKVNIQILSFTYLEKMTTIKCV